MTGRIDIPAEDVWGYIKEMMMTDGTATVIAENTDAGTYVTVEFDGGFPVLAAYADDEEVERTHVTKDNCEDNAQMLYDTYISAWVSRNGCGARRSAR